MKYFTIIIGLIVILFGFIGCTGSNGSGLTSVPENLGVFQTDYAGFVEISGEQFQVLDNDMGDPVAFADLTVMDCDGTLVLELIDPTGLRLPQLFLFDQKESDNRAAVVEGIHYITAYVKGYTDHPVNPYYSWWLDKKWLDNMFVNYWDWEYRGAWDLSSFKSNDIADFLATMKTGYDISESIVKIVLFNASLLKESVGFMGSLFADVLTAGTSGQRDGLYNIYHDQGYDDSSSFDLYTKLSPSESGDVWMRVMAVPRTPPPRASLDFSTLQRASFDFILKDSNTGEIINPDLVTFTVDYPGLIPEWIDYSQEDSGDSDLGYIYAGQFHFTPEDVDKTARLTVRAAGYEPLYIDQTISGMSVASVEEYRLVPNESPAFSNVQPPDKPTGLKISELNDVLTISWDSVSAADGYLLYLKINDGSYYQRVDLGASEISWTDSQLILTDDSSYSYKVLAYANYDIDKHYYSESSEKAVYVSGVSVIENGDLDGGYWDNLNPVLPGWTITTDGVYDTDANHQDPGYYDLRMVTGEYGSTGRYGSFNPWNNPGGWSVDKMEISQEINVPSGTPTLRVVGSSTGYGTYSYQYNGRTEIYVDGTMVAAKDAVNTTEWIITADLTQYAGTTVELSLVRPGASISYGDVWWDSVSFE